MALFVLDTDLVSSSEESMKKMFNQLSELSGSVSSFEVDLDEGDNFDFSGAKSVIANNIDACATRVNNTASYMDVVVTAHTNLQKNEFIDPVEKARLEALRKAQEEKRKEEEEKQSQKQRQRQGSNYRPSFNPGKQGGSGGQKYSGGNKASTGLGIAGIADLSSGLAVEKVGETITEKSVEVNIVKNVGYAYIDLNEVPETTTKLFQNEDFTTQDSGYTMIGSRYVIACNSEVGKVGDVIAFTKNDGTLVECVVGYNTVSDKYKDSINFIIDSDKKSVIESDETKLLLNDLKSIVNKGPLSSLSETGTNESIIDDGKMTDKNLSSETMLAKTEDGENNEKGVGV